MLRIINGIALLAAVLWLIFQPGWEPAVTSFALLAVFAGLLYAKDKPALEPPRKGGAGNAAPQVVEKWVDFKYPSDSGLQAKLEATGYRVAWCLDNKLARKIELDGWEVVIEPDQNGVPTKFRLKDRPADQTLIKKR